MGIIQLHTPSGVIEVNSETVTDEELTALGMTRADLKAILYPLSVNPTPDYLRACEILSQSPPAMTMIEVWELLRILGKSLGYRFE